MEDLNSLGGTKNIQRQFVTPSWGQHTEKTPTQDRSLSNTEYI